MQAVVGKSPAAVNWGGGISSICKQENTGEVPIAFSQWIICLIIFVIYLFIC